MVEDDGGDEPFAYEVHYSPIDPITNDVVEWHTAYKGIRRFKCKVEQLLPNTEYVFRVAAVNMCGRSAWSEYVTATTESAPEGIRAVITQLPKAWLALESNLDDAFARLGADPADFGDHWDDLVSMMKRCHHTRRTLPSPLSSYSPPGSPLYMTSSWPIMRSPA